MNEPSNRTGKVTRRFRPVVALDRTRNELNLLFASSVDREVNESALDLCPLVADLMGKPVSVLLESLMQDAYYQKASVAAGSRFRKLLEGINVHTVLRCGFKKL